MRVRREGGRERMGRSRHICGRKLEGITHWSLHRTPHELVLPNAKAPEPWTGEQWPVVNTVGQLHRIG